MPISKRLQDEINEASQRALRRRIRSTGQTQEEEGEEYVGPLDLVPGAVVAYGVRALSAAMLGQDIFRLIRDSDNAEMNFSSDAVTGDAPVASITAWLAGANGYVVTLFDQSGNGKHIVGSGTNALFSSLNSKSAFSLSSDLTIPGFTLANGELYALITGIGGVRIEMFSDGDTYAGVDFKQNSGVSSPFSLLIDADANEGGATYTKPGSDFQAVANIVSKFGANSYKMNNSALTESSSSDTVPLGELEFTEGEMKTIAGATSSKMQETILYGTVPSGANQLSLQQNIAAYYGISLS